MDPLKKSYSTDGKHILADLYQVENYEYLDSIEKLSDLLIKAVKKSNSHFLSLFSHKYEPQGITMGAIIEESLLSIHTYPEHKYCTVDFYSCGTQSDPEAGVDYIISVLKPNANNSLIIKRGNMDNLGIGSTGKKKR